MFLDGYTNNFETLLRAVQNGDVALAECKVKETGESAAVLVAHFVDDEGMHNLVPLARMFDGDPYEILDPPGE